jgi:hypothetical protein
MARDDVIDERGTSPEDERVQETLVSIRRDYGQEASEAPGATPPRPQRSATWSDRSARLRRVGDQRHPARPSPAPERPAGRWLLWVLLGLVAAVAAVVVAVGLHGGGGGSSAARAAAGAINLRAGDLPGYTVQAPQNTATGHQIDARLQSCIGTGAGQHAGSIDVTSPTFASGSGLLARQVESDVTIQRSSRFVASDLALMRSGRVQACLRRALEGLSIPLSTGGAVARIYDVNVTRLPIAARGADRSFGIRVTMSMGARGRHVRLYLDLIGDAVGRDELSLVTFAVTRPFPARTEQRLLSLLVSRAEGRVVTAPRPRSAAAARHTPRRTKSAGTARVSRTVAPPPATTTPTSTTTTTMTTTHANPTVSQLGTFESILKQAESGRQALANGDVTAAIANRRSVVQRLTALRSAAQLAPAVRALRAAESYSLHADTACGRTCPAGVDQRATQLKRAFLAIFNPLAARSGTATYAAGEI